MYEYKIKNINKQKKNKALGRTYPGLWENLSPVYGAEVTVQPSIDKDGWTVYDVACVNTCRPEDDVHPWGALLGYDAKRLVVRALTGIPDYEVWCIELLSGNNATWWTVIRLLESKGCRVTRTARGGYHFSF